MNARPVMDERNAASGRLAGDAPAAGPAPVAAVQATATPEDRAEHLGGQRKAMAAVTTGTRAACARIVPFARKRGFSADDPAPLAFA